MLRKKVLSAFIITATLGVTGVTSIAMEPVKNVQDQVTINQEMEQVEGADAFATLSYTGQVFKTTNIKFKVTTEAGYEEVMNGKSIVIDGVTAFSSSSSNWDGNELRIQIKEGYKITKDYLNNLLKDINNYPEGVEEIEVVEVSREDVKASSIKDATSQFNGGVRTPARMKTAYIHPDENKITFEFDAKLYEEDLNLISGEDELLSGSRISIEDNNKIVITKLAKNKKFDLSNAPKLVIGGNNPSDIFIVKNEIGDKSSDIQLNVIKTEKDANTGITSTIIKDGTLKGIEGLEGKFAETNEVTYNGAEVGQVKMKFKFETPKHEENKLNGTKIKLIGHGLSTSSAKFNEAENTIKVVLGSGAKREQDIENLINTALPEGYKIDVQYTSGVGYILPTAFDSAVFATLDGGVATVDARNEQITVKVEKPSATGRLSIAVNAGDDTFAGKVLVIKGDSEKVVLDKIIKKLEEVGMQEKYEVKNENNNLVITQKGEAKDINLEVMLNEYIDLR